MEKIPVPVNLNTRVKLKLTDFGLKILNRYALSQSVSELPLSARHILVRSLTPTDDGEITLPLWESMHIFGPHMEAGDPQSPFHDNSFTLFLVLQE